MTTTIQVKVEYRPLHGKRNIYYVSTIIPCDRHMMQDIGHNVFIVVFHKVLSN